MKLLIILDASGSCLSFYDGLVGLCESLIEDGYTGLVGNASDVFKTDELGFDGLRALTPMFGQGYEERILEIAAAHPDYLTIFVTDDAGATVFSLTKPDSDICIVNVESQVVTCKISGPIDQQPLINSLMKAMPCPALL